MIHSNDLRRKRNLAKRDFVEDQEIASDQSSIDSSSSDLEYMQELEEQLNSEKSKLGPKTKKGHKYAKISNQQRALLIDLVETTGCSIKSAAKQLKINNSTAKAIIQVYKRDGRKQKKSRKDPNSQALISQRANNCQGNVSRVEINYSYIRGLETEKEQLALQVIEKDHLIKSLTDQSLQLSNQISALNEHRLFYQNQLEQMHQYYGSVQYRQPFVRHQYQFQYFK